MGIWNTVQKWQGKSVPPCSMIVAAAGSSCRMGGQDKLFAPLAGVPVLTRIEKLTKNLDFCYA